ncbi:MAG: RAMP superfamily CRISPR-associated protein, partial [Bacteroidales bacterium]
IQGTSLMGVLRSSLLRGLESQSEIEQWSELLGSQKTGGSRLLISNAHLVGAQGSVIEGIDYDLDWSNDYYAALKNLPVRDHVRMTHRGGADCENSGKFDEEVLLKGVRFVFQIELKGSEFDREAWSRILQRVVDPSFRIGGSTRKGFGELRVVESRQGIYDLSDASQLSDYCQLSGSFNESFGELISFDSTPDGTHEHYRLCLRPDDFFLFSSGDADELVDMTPKRESVVMWDGQNIPTISEELTLIPASSIKGAISHRMVYHYNRLTGMFADSVESISDHVGENSLAVREIFGYASNFKYDDGGQRGRVISSDIFKSTKPEVILQHVAIDRFTGGAIDGALFNERVSRSDDWEVNLYLERGEYSPYVVEAFESALCDIANGSLPLGGGVMRGHGVMCGEVFKNNQKI